MKLSLFIQHSYILGEKGHFLYSNQFVHEIIILIFIQHKETGHLNFIMADGGDNGARRWRALKERQQHSLLCCPVSICTHALWQRFPLSIQFQ